MNYLLTDEEYGKAQDSLVICCIDVAVTYNGQILLERRENKPIQNEWWIFGGRMLVRENFKQAAHRNVLRELELDIADLDRFVELQVFNLIWPDRREPVSENGCHHLLVAHCVEITENEKHRLDQFLENKNEITKWFQVAKPDEPLLPEMEAILSCLPN